jgi:hypothetical protein
VRLSTSVAQEVPVNDPELTLRAMLDRAGLHGYRPQHPIDLGRPLGTTPDFFYEPKNDIYKGLCIYLIGMSGHLQARGTGSEIVTPFERLLCNTNPNSARTEPMRSAETARGLSYEKRELHETKNESSGGGAGGRTWRRCAYIS